jgi:hypothetical protein
MDVEEVLRHIAEHARQLVRAHSGVGTESREHGLEAVAVILPRVVGELACAGVFSALIGWDGENVMARAEFAERVREQELQLLR